MDQVNPEFSKTPPECAITGSVPLELRPDSETDGYERPESETDGYERPESETDGYVRPESETDVYVPPEQMEQTSTFLGTEDKNETCDMVESFDDRSMNFLQLQNIKRDILYRLNRKMSKEVSATEVEVTLTFDDSNQAPIDTVEIQSLKIPNQHTEETLGCSLGEADMTEKGPSHQSDGTEADMTEKRPSHQSDATEAGMTEKDPSHQSDGPDPEDSKVLPDDSTIPDTKKESKRSRIPIKAIPKTPEKVNIKKSKLPTKVIQVKPKTSEKMIKKIDFKKSKIPTRVTQDKRKAVENSLKNSDTKISKIPTRVSKVRCQAAENSSKKSDMNISKIPSRVSQVRRKAQENSPTKSESKKCKIPTRFTQVKCKAVEKLQTKSDWKQSNIPVNRGSPLAEMVLEDIDLEEFKIPIKIPNLERLMDTSRMPVVVKDSENSVTVATLVEVKVSRLPHKLRSFFHKLKRPNAKKSDKKGAKTKKVRFSLPIDDIYRKALSGKDRIKSRLPMPIRVTHPGKLYPPPSQIPLAFSRFPNPARVRKITLLRRVKKALTKQMAKINWKPKLNFPNLELFFQNIRGNNKVMPINA